METNDTLKEKFIKTENTEFVDDVENLLMDMKSNMPFTLSPSSWFVIIIGCAFLFAMSVYYGYTMWFICAFIICICVMILINTLITTGGQSTFQIGPFFIFIMMLVFCGYVFVGLYVSQDVDKNNIVMYVLSWVSYTFLCMAILNVILTVYYWSIIRLKTGPPGIRGIIGSRGKKGIAGKCNLDAMQSFTIKELSEHINKLYKNQTGNDLLDPTTHKFVNNYLNTKISLMATSNQMNMLVNVSATNKVSVQNLIDYLKTIWTEWFNLLYNASNGEWFLDQYGDENSTWSNSQPIITSPNTLENKQDNTSPQPTLQPLNPFDEMKKYDVFNWGLTRSFRPLKLEICKSTPLYESGKLPIKRKGKLKIIESNDYKAIGMDKGTGGNPDISWWRAKPVKIGTETYYPMGDVPMSGDGGTTYYGAYKSGLTTVGTLEYNVTEGGAWGMSTINGPDIKTMLVSGDVVPPVNYTPIWAHSGAFNPALMRPVCPEGYTNMGDIVKPWYGHIPDIPITNPPMCVPTQCVEPVNNNGYPIWSTGSLSTRVINGWYNGNPPTNNAKPENAYNLMRTDDNGIFYKLKDSCLNVNDDAPTTKKPEPENAKLGIGWYGSPFKVDPKYSIFTFLNLVPEGLIIHEATGRRFYIIHYGGEDVNKFIILDYNSATSNFDSAVQTDSDPASLGAKLRDISRNDVRQQWIITFGDNDKKKFTMMSVFNQKKLYIGLEPVLGDSMYSTVDLNNLQKPYNTMPPEKLKLGIMFSFVPAFGVHTDILDKNNQSSQS